ncbi:MAG: hypothetical protein GX045_04080 [Clostridiaceae bacterium]|nr:hypothetical protein [Clostridiaceae bacterium]
MSNLDIVAHKTNTAENELWHIIRKRFKEIRNRIDNLPRTLTYNDFYWTNLVVAQDKSSAMMLDFNLLGKGYAYGDIRNVTGSLSKEAADAFLHEYGDDFYGKEEKLADKFLAHLVTLVRACELNSFPGWAERSLEELKDGTILNSLIEWLDG